VWSVGTGLVAMKHLEAGTVTGNFSFEGRKVMTKKEEMERERLHCKRATKKLTKKEILRCMELDKKGNK
jgi:hypothetical protein